MLALSIERYFALRSAFGKGSLAKFVANIKAALAAGDIKYRKFHSYLLPGTDNILGVRIPQLRTMAKEIIKKDDWRPFVETANTTHPVPFPLSLHALRTPLMFRYCSVPTR